MKILTILTVLFFLNSPVFADKVTLKSGKVVEGTILERSDDFIRMDTGLGVPLTYYLDEILSQEASNSTTQNISVESSEENLQDEKNYYDEGLNHFTNNDYEQAIKSFEQEVTLHPDHMDAYLNLGYALGIVGRNDEAINYFQKAKTISPENAEVELGLGTAYLASGRMEEARDHIEEAKSKNPENPEVYLVLVSVYMQLNDEARLKENLEKAKELYQKLNDAEGLLIVEELTKELNK